MMFPTTNEEKFLDFMYSYCAISIYNHIWTIITFNELIKQFFRESTYRYDSKDMYCLRVVSC